MTSNILREEEFSDAPSKTSPQTPHLVQRFLIGQEVQVVPSEDFGHWSHDWRDQRLWVAGVTVDVDKGALDYWLSDCWPVEHRGNLTDGFAQSDITPVVRVTRPQVVEEERETARPSNPQPNTLDTGGGE